MNILKLTSPVYVSEYTGSDDDYGCEISAEECGCRIRYSRNYNVSHISW